MVVKKKVGLAGDAPSGRAQAWGGGAPPPPPPPRAYR